jgi:hypothetical protein
MKKVLFFILLLVSTTASAQFFEKHKDFTGQVLLATGFGAELGSFPTSHKQPFGYSFGTAFEFGNKVSDNFDWSVYAKGHFYLCKYASLTAQMGVKDLIDLQAGLGLRVSLPTEKFNIILEPVWRTENSIMNLGLQYKLN